MNRSIDTIIKHSFLYSYVLSQPLATYIDAYPALQNKQLLEAEQLAYGEHGQTVRVLQKKLNTLAYYDDDIDGDFGILTEYALKKFQLDNQIEISGQTDNQTVITLIESEKKKHLKKLEELSASVYPGMHNDDVKIVQETLVYFGYYEGKIDGIYGPLTTQALEIAEEKHDIELTNKVDQKTLIQLYEEENYDTESEVKEIVQEDQPVKEEVIQEEPAEIKVLEKEKQHNGDLIQVAQSFIGTPYVWGGDSPSGFDCSGFIQFVYNSQNITVPRTVSDTWNFAESVERPSVGDLVFFETYQPGPSHAGFYLGDGKFIHAGSSRGVEISELKTDYWQQRYLGAKRIR